MEYRWKCKDCGLTFRTKALLYIHRHAEHNIATRDTSHICPHCHQHYEGKRQKHFATCPNLHHGHKHTEESKRKLSDARKKWLKENPDKHPWKNKNKFKSVPCEKLKKILRKYFNFIEEYTDNRWGHNYSLDIAFLDRKIAVEVNGAQHYNKDGNLKPYYQKRHNFLESNGWLVLEVFYIRCFKENEIEKIKTAIQERVPIPEEEYKLLFQNKRKSIEEKRKERELKFKKAKQEGKINSNGTKIVANKYSEEKWLQRKTLIENSGVDLTKFGWVAKVAKLTGLTNRMIYLTTKHFKDKFAPRFIRKPH